MVKIKSLLIIKGRLKGMKNGLQIGDSKILKITVTEEMFAQFGDELVHPVYSTASMVYHMEWVSRDLILPYLEDNEESAGAAVMVEHIAPTGLGSEVTVTAVCVRVENDKVITEVTAENENGVTIGKGEVKQAVLPKNTIRRNVEKQVVNNQ